MWRKYIDISFWPKVDWVWPARAFILKAKSFQYLAASHRRRQSQPPLLRRPPRFITQKPSGGKSNQIKFQNRKISWINIISLDRKAKQVQVSPSSVRGFIYFSRINKSKVLPLISGFNEKRERWRETERSNRKRWISKWLWLFFSLNLIIGGVCLIATERQTAWNGQTLENLSWHLPMSRLSWRHHPCVFVVFQNDRTKKRERENEGGGGGGN